MKLTLPRLPKLNKTWAILGAALAIGLVAAFATRSFLSAQVEEIEARGKYQTVEIVVAKTAIEKNSVLSKQNLAVRKIPVEYAHSGAVKPEDFDRIDGGAIAYGVNQGEMILWSQMAGKRAPTFSARLAPGQRAITVAVDEINSISGMLEPGDLIDLMYTTDQHGKKVAFPVMQSVQVIATGQRSADDPKGGEHLRFATVTLNATPDQARNIILARETGKLIALLRNPDDKQAIGRLSNNLLFPSETPATQRHPNARRGIPVLYGGSGATYPPAALHLGRHQDAAETQPSSAAPVKPPPVQSIRTAANSP